MSSLKRYFVTHKVAYGALAGLVLAGSTLLLNSGDKDPISYEIQLPNEQMTLPREGVMTSISDGLNGKQKLNFVVLIGETGIGKTTLARRYIKK